MISFLGRRTAKPLGLNLYLLLVSTNYLILTDAIDEVLLTISAVFISCRLWILLYSALT